jgi:hypothetical protein
MYWVPILTKNKDKIKSYDENNAQDKEKRKSNVFSHLNSSHRNLPTILKKLFIPSLLNYS